MSFLKELRGVKREAKHGLVDATVEALEGFSWPV